MKMRKHYWIQEQENNLDRLCYKAEINDVYVVQSLERCLAYMYRDEEFAIVTTSGQMRMRFDEAEALSRELLDILQDIRDLKSMGVSM